MANSDEKDLMGIGRHCAFPECNQLDFLPFTCDCCKKDYCIDHRTYAAHHCEKAGEKEQVFVCPLCARAVKMQAGDNANDAFERHCQTECDPSNYARVHKKPRCPVPGCKEKLTSINSYTCKDCRATVCLRHRLATDHKCPGRPAAAAAAAQGRFALPQALKGLFSGGSGGSVGGGGAAKQAGPVPKQPARNAAAGSAAGSASMQAQLQQYRSRQQQQQRASGAAPAASAGAPRGQDVMDLTGSSRPGLQQQRQQQPGGGSGGGPELCQQCGAQFATVQELISHAERVHMDGWSSGAGMGAAGAQRQQQLERCPHCGRQFGDAVALVAHVEREHGSSQSVGCVLC